MQIFEIPISESNLAIVRPPNKVHVINDSICCVGVPYSDTLTMLNCIHLLNATSIKVLHPDSIFNHFNLRQLFIDFARLDISLASKYEWFRQYQYDIGNCYVWDIQEVEYPEVVITGNFVIRYYMGDDVFPIIPTFSAQYNFSTDSLYNLQFIDSIQTNSVQGAEEWKYDDKFAIADEHLADTSGIWGVQTSLRIPNDSVVSLFVFKDFNTSRFINDFPIKYPDSIIAQFKHSTRSIPFAVEMSLIENKPYAIIENREIVQIESGKLLRTVPTDIAKDVIMWDDRPNHEALAALVSSEEGLSLVNVPLDSNQAPYVFYTFPEDFAKKMYAFSLEHNQLVSIHLTGEQYTLKQHLFHE